MTLAISLGEKQFVSAIEQRDSKLIYADKVQKWFAPYFHPKRIEVWKNSTDEAIGGERLDTIPVGADKPFLEAATKGVYTKGAPLDNTILLVQGTWEDKKHSLPAYMSINLQQKWAETYGDIEMNVYASRDIEDIVQLIWENEEMRIGLVERFTKEFSEYYDKAINTESLVYGLGAPLGEGVSVKNWKASYFKNPNFYFLKFLSSLQSDFPDIKPYVRMMNHSVLASDLYGTTFFTEIVESIGQSTNVAVDYSNSISLIGRASDSYAQMYQELSESVFRILSHSLETSGQIDARISGEVARVAGYDIDSLRPKGESNPSDSS